MARTPSPVAGRLRWLWWLLAYGSLGLGLVGIVVPGLPTVPFVLLAAYAAARGSSRLHRWLLAHRQFGPVIRDWQAQGAVSRRAKWLATTMMAGSAHCGDASQVIPLTPTAPSTSLTTP